MAESPRPQGLSAPAAAAAGGKGEGEGLEEGPSETVPPPTVVPV